MSNALFVVSHTPFTNTQGVFVEGDVSLQDYNEATAVVRRELHEGEQIIQLFASQQLPQRRDSEKDRSVSGGEGRYFIFERLSGKLQLSAMWNWIA